MDKDLTNIFLLPMGFGSAIVLYLSSDLNGTLSLFTDNNTYQLEIYLIMFISLFYFVIDLLHMLCHHKSKHNVYIIHHLIGISSVILVYTKYYFMVKYLLSFLTFEISTPFLNMAISCHKRNDHGLKSKVVYLLFFIMYTTIRIVFGSILVCKAAPLLYSMPYPTFYLAALPIILQLLNYYWYTKIIKLYGQKVNVN